MHDRKAVLANHYTKDKSPAWFLRVTPTYVRNKMVHQGDAPTVHYRGKTYHDLASFVGINRLLGFANDAWRYVPSEDGQTLMIDLRDDVHGNRPVKERRPRRKKPVKTT